VKPGLDRIFFEQILRFKDPAEMAPLMEGLHKAGLPHCVAIGRRVPTAFAKSTGR
jgi:hypothetical protein